MAIIEEEEEQEEAEGFDVHALDGLSGTRKRAALDSALPAASSQSPQSSSHKENVTCSASPLARFILGKRASSQE